MRAPRCLPRNEWERDIAGKQPDLDAAHGTALAPLLSKKLRRNLKPMFETHVRRTVYPIHSEGSETQLHHRQGEGCGGVGIRRRSVKSNWSSSAATSPSFSSWPARWHSKSRLSCRSRARPSRVTRLSPVTSHPSARQPRLRWRPIRAGNPRFRPSPGHVYTSSSPTGPPCNSAIRKGCTRCASRCGACAPQSHCSPTSSLILKRSK